MLAGLEQFCVILAAAGAAAKPRARSTGSEMGYSSIVVFGDSFSDNGELSSFPSFLPGGDQYLNIRGHLADTYHRQRLLQDIKRDMAARAAIVSEPLEENQCEKRYTSNAGHFL